MIFNSFSYLIFFPVVTLLYFLLPKKIRWVWLLVSSYYFYMNWHAEYALLMAASTVVTYACALLVSRFEKQKTRKLVLIAGIVFNVGLLGYFKYTGMFIDVLNRACAFLGLEMQLPQVDILLPVGISFYTFQALGYMIDVYKKRTKAETNLFRYALFISFFPQLVAGPIERSSRLLKQLSTPHDFDYRRARDGLLIMLLGFFEKVVIADRAAIYVNAVFGDWLNASGAQIALATAVFAIQDLCDFAGYSYIAIGTAKVLGVELMTNFRQPYFAHSVTNFWARWHISLSSWFRDYIYFPLGAGRKGPARKALNVMIVYTVSGLWHGAALKYVAWGMLNGALAGRRRDSAAVAPQTLHQAASPLQHPVDGLPDSHHDAHLPRQLAECRAGHAPAHPDRVDRACAGNGLLRDAVALSGHLYRRAFRHRAAA